MGCIHSTQGYDLNYGFIIMGNEIGYDTDKNISSFDHKNILIKTVKNSRLWRTIRVYSTYLLCTDDQRYSRHISLYM